MSLQAILFDLDDTLLWDERSVEEAFQATCRTAQEASGAAPGALEQAVRRQARALYEGYETYPFTQMIGINPFEGLWANFSGGSLEMFRKLEALAPDYRKQAWTRGLAELGIDDPELGARLAEQFPRERRARPIVYEETFEVLNSLKSDYRLLLLTNGSPDLQREKIEGVPELAGYFDHIVISGEFGVGKPDPALFRHALQLLGMEPARALMVGDKLTTDILGSHRTGIRNVWINRRGLSADGTVKPDYEITDLRQLIDLVHKL